MPWIDAYVIWKEVKGVLCKDILLLSYLQNNKANISSLLDAFKQSKDSLCIRDYLKHILKSNKRQVLFIYIYIDNSGLILVVNYMQNVKLSSPSYVLHKDINILNSICYRLKTWGEIYKKNAERRISSIVIYIGYYSYIASVFLFSEEAFTLPILVLVIWSKT